MQPVERGSAPRGRGGIPPEVVWLVLYRGNIFESQQRDVVPFADQYRVGRRQRHLYRAADAGAACTAYRRLVIEKSDHAPRDEVVPSVQVKIIRVVHVEAVSGSQQVGSTVF